MIAKAAKTGTSFKGASLYYLHDKRMEGEQQRMTSERVDWTARRDMEQRYTAKEPDKSQQQKDERLRKAFEKANFIKERQSRQGRGRSRSRGISR